MEEAALPEQTSVAEGTGWASEQSPKTDIRTAAAVPSVLARRLFTGEDAVPQKKSSSPEGAGWASERPANRPMPGFFEATGQGLVGGFTDIGKTSEAFTSGRPTAEGEASPAAAPYELRDIWEPSRGAAKTGYRLGKSWPTLGAGIAGGAAGAAAGAPFAGVGAVPGGIAGGVTGAAIGSAIQTLGPAFGEELKKTPDDPEGAWTRAMEHTAVSSAAAGLSWGLFPLRFLNGPVKNMAFQAFGVQPAVAVTERATQNVLSGKPVTEGMGEAYTEGAVGTLVPAIGHKILEGPKAAVAPPVDPVKQQLLQSSDYKLNLAEQTRQLADDPATNTTDALKLKEQANTLETDARYERFLGMKPEDTYQTKGPAGKVVDSYIGNFQPDLFSDRALVADAKTAQNRSKYAQAQDVIMKRADERRYEWNKIDEPDRATFMQAFESDPRTWSPDLTNRYADLVNRFPHVVEDAKLLRKWLFDSYMSEKEAGSKAEYIINYLPHQFKKPVEVQRFFQNQMSPQGAGPTWFQKARFYDTVELAKQAGFELATTNPFDLVTNRLLSGADMRSKMNWLNEAYSMGLAVPKEQAPASLMSTMKASLPWQEISAPNGSGWMLAPDAQALWKNGMEAKGLWARPDLIGDSYRGWMALKSAWVPIKLGLSLFHPIHVSHITMSNNISRALNETFGTGTPGLWNRIKALPEAALQSVTDQVLAYPLGIPFTGVKLPAGSHLGKQVREAWFVPPEKQTPQQKYLTDIMNEAGVSPQLSEQLRTSGERQFKDAVQTHDWKGATLGSISQPLPAVRLAVGALSKPIFEQWIPNLKAAAVIREAESMARRFPDIMNNSEQRAVAMRAIGKQVDNRFGEMFYKSLFWNRTIKDASIGSFLSLGWNLGFARDFVGGALAPTARRFMDNPTPNRQALRDVTNKGTNLFMYGMSAMLFNALMTKGLSGENPEGWDYIFPRIGGLNPDGSPRRITNPFYTREVPMAMKHIDEAQSVKIGLAEMLKNKLMFGPFIEMMTNHNYFGNQIWDENSPYWQQWGQLGKNVLSEQLNPMSISGAKRALQLSGKPFGFADVIKQATDRDVYMPMMGFGPAPAYASRGPIENRIAYLARKYVYPSEKPYQEAEKLKERGDAVIAYKQAVQSRDETAISHWASKLAELGMPTDRIRKIQPGGELKNMFQRIGTVAPSQQIDLLKRMSPEQFKFYYPAAAKKVRFDRDVQELVKRYYQ